MLGPLHKHAVVSAFLNIEGRLAELEPLLAPDRRPSPFDQCVNDLSPAEARTVKECFGRIRGTLLRCLERHDIPIDVQRIGLRRSLQTSIALLSVAVAELGPNRLRGFGMLDDAGSQELENIQRELRQILDSLSAYLGSSSADGEVARGSHE